MRRSGVPSSLRCLMSTIQSMPRETKNIAAWRRPSRSTTVSGGTVSGSGVLARLAFDVAGAPGVTTTLEETIDSFERLCDGEGDDLPVRKSAQQRSSTAPRCLLG